MIDIATRWLEDQQSSGTIDEGHLIGSVLRPRDFGAQSDVDLVLLVRGPQALSSVALSKLQFKLERRLEVTLFTPAQLVGYSPCHRKSNLLVDIYHQRPQSRMAQLLGHSCFFRAEFQRFWRWHTVLRITEVYGRDLSFKTYEEQLRTAAARAAVVEQRGFLHLEPEEVLLDFLGHWPVPWWRSPCETAEFATHKLALARPALAPLDDVAIPAPTEEWLIREFWDERARLLTINRLGPLVDFLLEDGAKLKMKIDEARA